MKMRNLMVGVIAAGFAGTISGAEAAERIEIAVKAMPEIKVDGASRSGPYDSVQTKILQYVVSARSDKLRDMTLYISKGEYDLHYIQNYWLETYVEQSWNKYKLTVPYMDLEPGAIVNERTSPIKLCNERLNTTSGAAREKFLKSGESFVYHQAFRINAFDSGPSMDNGSTFASVKITCIKLDRPRPRENSETKPAPKHPGKPLPPAVSEATLRIEPGQVVQMGKFLCPSQLKLYGRVETNLEFSGKSIFVGPGYLSSVTQHQFTQGGGQNVVGTYKMDWQQMGDKAIAPNQGPKKQKLSFRFNISDKDGKVRDYAERTIEVSCRKIKVNAPTIGDEMTVAPSN